MCDSSSSSSWVLRAMRRAKRRLPYPGIRLRSRRRRVHEHGVGAAHAAANAATVVRNMFTHGSRWAIIGSEVMACTVAAPASAAPTTSATRAHSSRAARSFAIVMNWSSSAANRKLI